MAKKPSARERYAAELTERAQEMPIVNANAEIVAWSSLPPEMRGSELYHEEAMRLVGGIKACYVEIEDLETARRAGAPANWRGIWRCLAICSDALKLERGIDFDEPVRSFRVRPARL